jgi:hypothetical protein
LAWGLVRQWRASGYPSTTGTVTHSAAVYSGGPNGGWQADIHYEYVVAGERYKADQLRYDSVNGNEDAAVAWSVTIAGTAVAWWRARDKYSELRRDKTSGTVEIRRRDGTHEVSLNSGLEAFCPNRRPSKTGEFQRFPLHLRFRDTDERRRSFKLPTAATPEEAARIANWLNELLGLPGKS